MEYQSHLFGYFYNQAVKQYQLCNDNGMRVSILELGGIITELEVPDRQGKLADVVLGLDSLSCYTRDSHYFGAMIGRVANRIEGARFELNGQQVKVDANAHEGRHCVHGGRFGYHRRIWRMTDIRRGPGIIELTLHLRDGDGEEGFNHDVDVYATYRLDNRNRLTLEYRASANGPTPISLTAHSYFNLFGHQHGSIADHELTLYAQRMLAQKEDRVPSGEIVDIRGSEFDYGRARSLADCVGQGLAINHSFVPESAMATLTTASASDPLTQGLTKMAQLKGGGRRLRLYSNADTLHFYNGHNLDGVKGKCGTRYEQFAGLCLEPKGYVNAINQPQFPCTIIKPGQEYHHRIVYDFSQ